MAESKLNLTPSGNTENRIENIEKSIFGAPYMDSLTERCNRINKYLNSNNNTISPPRMIPQHQAQKQSYSSNNKVDTSSTTQPDYYINKYGDPYAPNEEPKRKQNKIISSTTSHSKDLQKTNFITNNNRNYIGKYHVAKTKQKILSAKALYKKCSHTSVLITTDKSLGSGIIIDSSGIILTNYHVIDNSKYINVKLQNGSQYSVSGIGAIHPILDFAIIKINTSKQLPYIYLGESNLLEPGENIYAIGNPKGSAFSISDGIISQVDVDYTKLLTDIEFIDYLKAKMGLKYIQFTAPVAPGSSGGGLFNNKGELIGIPTMILFPNSSQNMNLAVPIDIIKNYITQEIKPYNNINNSYTLSQLFDNDIILGFYYLFSEKDTINALSSFNKVINNNKYTEEEQNYIAQVIVTCYILQYKASNQFQNLTKAKNVCLNLAIQHKITPSLHYTIGWISIIEGNTSNYQNALNHLQQTDNQQAQKLINCFYQCQKIKHQLEQIQQITNSYHSGINTKALAGSSIFASLLGGGLAALGGGNVKDCTIAGGYFGLKSYVNNLEKQKRYQQEYTQTKIYEGRSAYNNLLKYYIQTFNSYSPVSTS